MKNFKLYLLAVLASGILFSCKKDDNTSYTPPRAYDVQYANEIVEIEEYLETHYLVGSGINAVINKIPEGGSQIPLSQHPDLKYKMVNMASHEVDYKLYYINFNEGANERPTQVDSVFVSYKGWKTDGELFDSAPNSTWLTLGGRIGEAIEGFTQVLTEFKTGIYNTSFESFENSGAGIVIIPSGLGYYNSPPQSSNIGTYSTLVFSFNLNTLKYRDHDSDGIQSRFEARFYNESVEDNNENRDPRKYDSDGDDIPNYLDIDDDNDGRVTRFEIKKPDGTLYPFDEIPSCNGSSKKVHLDSSCIGPLEP